MKRVMGNMSDSNAFIKTVVLTEYKKYLDHIELTVGVHLFEEKMVEDIKLELADADSNLVVMVDTKYLDVETRTATFSLTTTDFKNLIDPEQWLTVGWVAVRIFVKLQDMAFPVDGVRVFQDDKTKLDADFATSETVQKSFVISPQFEKDAGLAFGTATVDTKIFTNYILNENGMRLPAMELNKRRFACYYATNYDTTSLDQSTILYETRNGRSITCSPYAIFKYLINNPKYGHFKHYWSVKAELLSEIKASMPPEMLDKMVLVVKESKEYFDLLLTAKYLIVNGSCLKSPFRKKTDQVSINTWHGVPIKHMAFDTPVKGHPRFRNVLRQFLALDYLITPNEHTTNVMSKAYKLHDLFQGEILEYGYPRMDVTVNSTDNVDKQAILGAGILLDLSKPNLVYMPTWRGGSTKQAMHGVETIMQEVTSLKAGLSNEYNVLVKVHPFLFKYVKDDSRLKGTLISDFCDPNEILAATDVMIADYSSVFFDFLPTKKPIVYYMKDRVEYENNRGLYISPDVLPGTVAYDLEELVTILKDLVQTDLIDDTVVRDEFIAKYSTFDDGNATKRIVERIFEGKQPEIGRTLKLTSDKKNVLITLRTLAPSKTVENYLKLTNKIDFDKYDVTQLCKLNKVDRINIPRVNPKVRQMFDTGEKVHSMEDRILVRHYRGKTKFNDHKALNEAQNREKGRLVPLAAFDYVVEFDRISSNNFEKLIVGKKPFFKRLARDIFRSIKR